MKEKKKLLWTLGLSLVYWIIIGIRFDVLYGLNDDIMIQSILSGGLSGQPSGMAVYMGQPLTGILALLYTVARTIPWLGLFLTGCYVLCFTLIMHRVLLLGKNNKQWMFGGCVVVLAFTAFCIPQYLNIHYTVASALMGATAIFLIGTRELREEKAIKGFGAYLLLVISFLIRKQVFFMLLPFLFGILFYRILCDKEWKRYVRQVCLCAVILLIFGAVHEILYSQNGWKEYEKFNDARTKLYDYTGVWEGEDAASYYKGIGLSEEQIKLYLAYDVMLDEDLSASRLQKMADFDPGQYGIKSPMDPSFREALWNYRTGLMSRGQDFPYNYFILLMYFVLIIIGFVYKDWKTIFVTGCFGLGRSAIWMYLLMQGRMPERVTVSLYLIEGLTLVCVLWNTLHTKKESAKPMVCRILVAALTLFLPIAAIINMQTAKERQAVFTMHSVEDKVIYDYFSEHPNDFYLLDVYATVNHAQYAIMSSRGEQENYLMLGGWITESPHVKNKLESLGYDSAAEALLQGENVFFVKKENEGLAIDVLEHLFQGYAFELQKSLDTINGNRFLIYKVSK